MAQSGYTPIQLYRTTTASAAPTAGNLADGELAINTNDGKLFYKDSGGNVQVIGYKTVPVSAGGTGLTSGTSGGIPYYSASNAIASSAALAANALVVGGGAGVAPSTVTTGTGVLTAVGNAVNTTGGLVTVNGTATLTNKTLTDPAIVGTILEDVYTIVDGAGFEVDPGNGSIQLITLGASRTPKATNFAAGEAITLMVDDGTAYTITWTDATWGGSGVVWLTDSGVAPTLSATGYTAIVLWKVSTQVYGARVGTA